jgi:hypothetical protein
MLEDVSGRQIQVLLQSKLSLLPVAEVVVLGLVAAEVVVAFLKTPQESQLFRATSIR